MPIVVYGTVDLFILYFMCMLIC